MNATEVPVKSFEAQPLDFKNRRNERIVRLFLGWVTMLLILPVLLILGVLIVKGSPALSWEFFTDLSDPMGGILPSLIGTLWLVGVALTAAVPLGIAAAIYLSEYAPDNTLTRIINLAIINLAGVPSIVHALFGLGAFVIFLKPLTGGTCILAASLTLAIMTLPVVIVSTRESLQAVPQAFREACWSLGATRWQTIRKVVLPNSISGILTGVIIQVSMTVGETAPIMYTGAVTYVAFLPRGVTDETMAMSLHLFNLSFVMQDVPEALPFGVALTLIGLVLALNSASIAFRMRLRGKKKW